MKKERESLHQLTNRRQCHKPVAELIGEINRQLKGWKNYFSIGYPQAAYWEIDWYFPMVRRTGADRVERLQSEIASSECLRRELFGRAGCGKPACPVRSGGGRPLSVTYLSTLPARIGGATSMSHTRGNGQS